MGSGIPSGSGNRRTRFDRGELPAYRVAYISGSKPERKYAMDGFSQSLDIAISKEVIEVSPNALRHMEGGEKPHLFFYTTGTETTPTDNLLDDIALLQEMVPDVPIMVRTEMESDNPLVQKLLDKGVHILDDRLEFSRAIEAIDRVRNGEHVVDFATTAGEVEAYVRVQDEIGRDQRFRIGLGPEHQNGYHGSHIERY